MNLNELFFFKVFPCNSPKNIDNNYIESHNKKNCYFYHEFHKEEDNIEKIIEEDRRREPISFSKFFDLQFSKLKEGQHHLLNFDTLFDLENDENNFNFYVDSLPLENPNKKRRINFKINFCLNETEFTFHMNRYKKNICRFWKINNKCKNEFCYNKHSSKNVPNEADKENIAINNIINNIINSVNNECEIEINEGIEEYRKAINKWSTQKEIKLIEIIVLYNYILSFENKYLSIHHKNKIQKNFEFFQKWYTDAKLYMNNIPTLELFLLGETSTIKYYSKKNAQEKISKNCTLLESLNINTNVCYISKYTSIKRAEIIKCVYAMLNSSDGVIIYGGHENNNSIKGISMSRKERDKFKIWFNSEFIKILIKYEDNLKYDFIDINDSDNGDNDKCVLVIEIKKIKGYKFLIKHQNKCVIIKEKFLNRNKNEKNKLLDDENIKELDLKEYLEILRIKLLEHYSQKFNVKI